MAMRVRASCQWLRLHVLYVVAFLDLLAVSMIIPSLSTYVKSMDGGALAFGGIMSLYGFLQFFSAPFAGSLSDIYGRRKVLLVCFVGCSFGYLLLGLSWNVAMVLLSRIPAALFKHTLDLIKIAVTDAEEPHNRSAAIGRLNAASNAGFIIGPVVGGYVSSIPYGFNYTTLLTTTIFALNYALISVFYKEPVGKAAASKREDDEGSEPHVDWRGLLRETRDKLLAFRQLLTESGPSQTLLIARMLLAMASIVYRTHFSTLLEDKFGTDSRSRGFILSYMGVLGALGSLSVGFVTKHLSSERLLLQLSSVVYVLTFVALSRVETVEGVYIVLIPQVVSISMLRASSIALQTSFVSPDRVGTFMGISSSLTSVARTVSPILSGWTYLLAIDGPAYGAALLATLSALLFCFSPHFSSLRAVAAVKDTGLSLKKPTKKTAAE